MPDYRKEIWSMGLFLLKGKKVVLVELSIVMFIITIEIENHTTI